MLAHRSQLRAVRRYAPVSPNDERRLVRRTATQPPRGCQFEWQLPVEREARWHALRQVPAGLSGDAARHRPVKVRDRPYAVAQVNAGERTCGATKTCRWIDDAGCVTRLRWTGGDPSITTASEHRLSRLGTNLNVDSPRKIAQLMKLKGQRDASRDG